MALQCPRCCRQYDVTLFEYGNAVRCECGSVVDLTRGHAAGIEPAAASDVLVAPQRDGVALDAGAARVALVCHAEAGEARVQVAGAEDAALTLWGRYQALALARRLLREHVTALYTSDATCCHETAEPIASELGVRVQATPMLRPAEGDGVLAFLREIVRRHPGATAVVVTHEAVCRSVLAQVLGVSMGHRHAFVVAPASVHLIEAGAARWRVALLNDTCHLESEAADR